jgi:tripartite ATP-independent transporter DctP family solute receptor
LESIVTSHRIISIALAAAFAAGPAHAKEFRATDIHERTYPTVQAVAYTSKLLSTRSGGTFSIKILPHGDQGSERLTLQQVRNGTLDMARINVSRFENIVPSAAVLALPFLFNSTAHMRRVLNGPIGDEILADMESEGFIGLCFYDNGPRSFYTSSKPIRTAADLKGMRVRVQEAGLWTKMMQALGAIAVPMPYSQGAAALKANVVDAAENNLPSYVAEHDFETARFYSLTRHSMEPGVLVFSKEVWNRLSQKERTMIRAAAKQSVTYEERLWDEREVAAREALVDTGAQIIADVDEKSFSDALAPVYTTFAADPTLQDLIQRIRTVDQYN